MYYISPLKQIPLDQNGNIVIRFFNPPSGYPSMSMIDVLDAKTPEELHKLDEFFAGKIVLIGEYGTLIHDEHFSPVNTGLNMPGVEFHANVLDGLLNNKTLISQGSQSVWMYVILTAFILILCFYFVRTWVAIGLLVFVLLFFFLFGWNLINLPQDGIVINLFFYTLTAIVSFVETYIYKFLIVDKNKRYIEGAFSRYISPEVVAEISKNASALELGGSNQRVAVFFTDIANFTTISESLGTQRIFTLLGEYLSVMTDVLIRNKGTLDKYIGDAIMGFF